ncbi:pilus assembly protein, partial [Pyxidicoccus sp. 3LG]
PIVDNIDVGYQAVRAGSYARASPSTLGNAIIWGVNETPGSAWGDDWPDTGLPAASTRLYDARKDFTVRGRLYFRSLYDPEKPDETRAIERWDAGRVMAMALRGGADPLSRNLITSSSAGELTTVSAEMADDNENSPLFPDSLCDEYANGRYTYDLNNDGKCGTPSIDADDKRVEGPTNDRNFLREWLHGWEDRHAPGASDVRRPWPMGGINLSTAAVAVPPYLDTWALNASPKERDDYRENFMKPLQERDTVAYVGTMNGFLHAFDAGAFRNATQDACATGPQLRGYFQTTGSCSTTPGTDRDYGSGQETFAYLPRTLLERYRNLYVQFPGSGTLPKPQADASATIANVDFGLEDGGTRKHEWKLSPTLSKADGAKTVLVSATGKNSPAVYALDITRPGTAGYPLPLWEFNLRDAAIDGAFTAARGADPTVNHPDNSGSRHAPSVARLAWGSHTTSAWTAVVGTDYSPSPTTRAGAVYLIDMKTGRPLNYGTEPEGELAGIITLEQGVGVAAESALVDLNRDGNYDVMYVPVTSGGVYRINLDKVDTDAPLGRKVKTCKVASAPAELSNHADAATGQDPSFQQLYSNLAVKVVRDNTTPTVRFYFGTGDNPDEFSDGPPNKDTFRYHLLAFEDTDPAGTGDCELMEPLWVRQLDPGQTVWGGVALSSEQVYATTAVGRAADICGLSQDESGRYYATGQLPTESGAAPPVSSASLDGHGINAPVVHDQHVFVLTATGKMKVIGDENWNNGAVAPGAARSRVLIYDAIPDGRMPQ